MCVGVCVGVCVWGDVCGGGGYVCGGCFSVGLGWRWSVCLKGYFSDWNLKYVVIDKSMNCLQKYPNVSHAHKSRHFKKNLFERDRPTAFIL